jgi:hypothetical protein
VGDPHPTCPARNLGSSSRLGSNREPHAAKILALVEAAPDKTQVAGLPPCARASQLPALGHSPHSSSTARKDAKTKIRREGFSHAGWPPSPARRMNHVLPSKGIPFQFRLTTSPASIQLARFGAHLVVMAGPFRFGDMGALLRPRIQNAGARALVLMGSDAHNHADKRGGSSWLTTPYHAYLSCSA